MDIASAIGFVAGALTTLSFVPQVIRTFRTRRADDLSPAMLLAFGVGVFLWLVHGLVAHSAPIIAANFITLVLVLTITVLKVYYARVSRRSADEPAVVERSASMSS